MLAAHIVIPTPLQANEAMEFHSSSTSLLSVTHFVILRPPPRAKEAVKFYHRTFCVQIIQQIARVVAVEMEGMMNKNGLTWVRNYSILMGSTHIVVSDGDHQYVKAQTHHIDFNLV
ncbi:unnamed protein product [Prunus armeniaca]|uniref:Uncharacterized protein n=1 Tax=Prunus armeniaca TaxID=36596 RepID=A0A6J5UIF6_PRUAR|nr:unnamed protein product [Prunus armeniaca]